MRRRPGADALLAVVLPAACVLALLVLHPDRDQPEGAPPVETALTTTSLVCPGALPGEDRVGVGTVGADPGVAVDGEVQVGLGATSAPVRVRTGRVSAATPGPGPAVVTGEDELAPGLVAGRARSAPLAAADCAPPVADQWFTAVGAGATHDSVVELVNPHAGPAIADIVVRSPTGLVDVPSLRSVSVPGGTSTRLDLGQVVPRQGELSLEVHTTRGRLAVHVVDAYDELGTGTRAEDWLPAQAAPGRALTLLGLVPGEGERRLVLANPGADEVRAEVKVVTPTSTYAPTGVEALRVAPDSTAAISLDDVLAQAAQAGATGLLVEATGPVTASLRQVVAGDTSLLTAAPEVARSVAVVPAGTARLLVGGVAAVGVATVAAYDAKGRPLPEQRVELTPGGGADVPLPEGAALVTLLAERTTVRAALLVTGTGTSTGAAAVPLRDQVLTGLVPDVRPDVP